MHTVSGPTEICLSWHAGFRHWWITHCLNAGTNGGFSWLEEDVRYLGRGGRGRVKRIRLEKGLSLGNTCSRLLLKGLFAKKLKESILKVHLLLLLWSRIRHY